MSEKQDRFWSKVICGPGCWNWTRATNTHGYGWVTWNKTQTHAHRVAWEITNGLIPKGKHVLHHCDNTNAWPKNGGKMELEKLDIDEIQNQAGVNGDWMSAFYEARRRLTLRDAELLLERDRRGKAEKELEQRIREIELTYQVQIKLKERAEKAEKESEGRRIQLGVCSSERTAEWRRAENLEAQVKMLVEALTLAETALAKIKE